jgi:hypothetical protein
MFRLGRPLFLLGVFLVASSPGFAEEKMAETPYYPTAVGTTWHYKTGDGSKFVMKVVIHEKLEKVPVARIELQNDAKKEQAFELISVTKDGVFRYSFSGTIPDKPIQVLKLPLKAGDKWTVDAKALTDTIKGTFTVGPEKDIEVPAGKFKAFPVTSEDLDASGLKASSTCYYAAGKGLILQEIKIGKETTVIKLEKFEAGK